MTEIGQSPLRAARSNLSVFPKWMLKGPSRHGCEDGMQKGFVETAAFMLEQKRRGQEETEGFWPLGLKEQPMNLGLPFSETRIVA